MLNIELSGKAQYQPQERRHDINIYQDKTPNKKLRKHFAVLDTVLKHILN